MIKSESLEETADDNEYNTSFIDTSAPFILKVKSEPTDETDSQEQNTCVEPPPQILQTRKETPSLSPTPTFNWSSDSDNDDDFFSNQKPEKVVKNIPKPIQPTSTEKTFDGKWSSDEDAGIKENFPDSDDEPLTKLKKDASPKKGKLSSDKKNKLTGKNACKFCVTIFTDKKALQDHKCEYLRCDPKNFICRICLKELNKATFHNHIHDGCNCMFCNREYANPWNLRLHMKRRHPYELQLLPPNFDTDKDFKKELYILPQKIENLPKQKAKFECGKFSKYIEESKLTELNPR